MPYAKNEDLPDQVTDNLPQGAQTIYREAFNSAFEQYDDPEDRRGDSGREETAHRVAWSAIKEKYAKNDEGEWKRKDADCGAIPWRSEYSPPVSPLWK